MLHAYENSWGFDLTGTYAGDCEPVPMDVTVDGKPYFFDAVLEKEKRFSFIKVLQGKRI